MELDRSELAARESGSYPWQASAQTTLRDRVYDARMRLMRWKWSAQHRGATARTALRNNLERRPFATIGIAMGAGMLIGFALSQFARRERSAGEE